MGVVVGVDCGLKSGWAGQLLGSFSGSARQKNLTISRPHGLCPSSPHCMCQASLHSLPLLPSHQPGVHEAPLRQLLGDELEAIILVDHRGEISWEVLDYIARILQQPRPNCDAETFFMLNLVRLLAKDVPGRQLKFVRLLPALVNVLKWRLESAAGAALESAVVDVLFTVVDGAPLAARAAAEAGALDALLQLIVAMGPGVLARVKLFCTIAAMHPGALQGVLQDPTHTLLLARVLGSHDNDLLELVSLRLAAQCVNARLAVALEPLKMAGQLGRLFVRLRAEDDTTLATLYSTAFDAIDICLSKQEAAAERLTEQEGVVEVLEAALTWQWDAYGVKWALAHLTSPLTRLLERVPPRVLARIDSLLEATRTAVERVRRLGAEASGAPDGMEEVAAKLQRVWEGGLGLGRRGGRGGVIAV